LAASCRLLGVGNRAHATYAHRIWSKNRAHRGMRIKIKGEKTMNHKKPRRRKRMNIYLSAKASVIAARLERRKDVFNFSEYLSRKLIVDFSSPQTSEDVESIVKEKIAQLSAEQKFREREHQLWLSKCEKEFEFYSGKLRERREDGGKE